MFCGCRLYRGWVCSSSLHPLQRLPHDSPLEPDRVIRVLDIGNPNLASATLDSGSARPAPPRSTDDRQLGTSEPVTMTTPMPMPTPTRPVVQTEGGLRRQTTDSTIESQSSTLGAFNDDDDDTDVQLSACPARSGDRFGCR